jgi:hypothetical protein
MFNRKENKGNFIIIRACVGCILPHNAALIKDGTYQLRLNGKNIDEPYYDYIIDENQLETFIDTNYEQLVKYKLIDDFRKEKNKDKHIDPIQVDSLKGYSSEYVKKP